MLITNHNVSDGLMNCEMGEITNIIVPENSNVVSTILVHFDSPRVCEDPKSHSIYKWIDPDSVPIKREHATFHIREKASYPAFCTQYPLYLCWTITTHKCQELTLPEFLLT